MQITEISLYDAFYSKLRSRKLLETEHMDYVNLLKRGLTTEQAVIKSKISKPAQLVLKTILTCNRYEARRNELIQGLFAVI